MNIVVKNMMVHLQPEDFAVLNVHEDFQLSLKEKRSMRKLV